MPRRRRLWLVPASAAGVAVIVTVAVLIARLPTAPSADEHLSQAQRLMEQRDLAGAVVALRNVLQLEPNRGAARALLARALIGLGDGAGALKELDRAKALGVEDSPAPRLEALLLEGRHAEVLGRLAVDPAAGTSPELLVLRGRAAAALNKPEPARAAFAAALKQSPDYRPARLGLAELLLAKGELEEAAQVLAPALEDTPGLARAWLLQGEIELSRKKYEPAMSAFARAGELSGGSLGARVGLTRALLLSDDVAGAKRVVDALYIEHPKSTPVLYWRAVTAASSGDPDGAVSAYRAVLAQIPNHPESLFGLGRIQLEQKRYSDAETVLRRLAKTAPTHLPTQKLLAAAQIRLRKPAAAIETLDPDGDGEVTGDPQLLGLLATAYRMQGEPERATSLLEQAVQLAPQQAAYQTELALGQVSAGEVDAAMASLQSAIALEPDQLQAEVLLVLVPLSAGRTEEALAAAKDLAARRTDSPMAQVLLGGTLLRADRTRDARNALEKALALNPDYPDALMNLGRMDLREQNVELARSRFERVIATRPNHPNALSELAALALAGGDVPTALAQLERARAGNERAVDARVRLSQLYARLGRRDDALTVAREAVALAPRHPGALLILARAQIGVSDAEGASATLDTLRALRPESAEWHVASAQVRILRGKLDAAETSLHKALEASPNHFQAMVELAQLALRRADTEAAIRWSRALAKAYPARPRGAALEGDSWRASGDHNQALGAYERAWKISPRSEIILAIAGELKALDQGAAANRRLREWLDTHPEDTPVANSLAITAQLGGQTAEAIDRYERLLASSEQPNIVALNNLAWLYERERPEKSLQLAKQASELAPENPAILDTLGWMFFRNGQIQQALGPLERAVSHQPGVPEHEYHLAAVLAANGERGRAQSLLTGALENENVKWSARTEAEKLRAELARTP